MAIKLTGTDPNGNAHEVIVGGPLIYDAQWKLTVDPAALKTGDVARPSFGCPGLTLTLDAEVV